MKKTSTRLADGRELIYYDLRDDTVRDAVDRRPLERTVTTSEVRRDPLLGDSVAIASHRQGRIYHPPANECPLCPSQGERLSEIPDSWYDVVVFENRFPSLAGDSGRCEVVCFTSDHNASFADLTEEQARLVLDAWTDRTSELSHLPSVEQVFCFENRGAEIGVTLGHPHGQIYAYPFTTPRTALMLRSLAAHKEATGVRTSSTPSWSANSPTSGSSWRPSTGSPSCPTRRTGRTRCTSTRSAGFRICSASTRTRAQSFPRCIWNS